MIGRPQAALGDGEGGESWVLGLIRCVFHTANTLLFTHFGSVGSLSARLFTGFPQGLEANSAGAEAGQAFCLSCVENTRHKHRADRQSR